MAYLDTATALFDTLIATCNGNTDVLFREVDITNPPGTRGSYSCISPNGAGRCETSRVDIDVAQIFTDTAVRFPGAGQPFTDNFNINMLKSIRHEVGHSIGTNNDGTSFIDMNNLFIATGVDVRGCTVSGWVPTELRWDLYSPHHIPEINAFY